MSKDLMNYEDVSKLALTVCRSGLFPAYKKPEETLTMMMIAQAEGRHPIDAMSRYHIIKGKPAKAAAAMQADFQASGGKLEIVTRNNMECEIIFSHPSSPKPVNIKWTIDDAKKAGLTGKEVWQKYPANLLFARVVSMGIKTVYPAATGLLYTPEEVRDFSEEPIQVKTEVIKEDHQVIKEKTKPVEIVQEVKPEVKSVETEQEEPAKVVDAEVIEDKQEVEPLVDNVLRQIKRMMPNDAYETSKEVIEDRAIRKPLQTLQYAISAYGREYFRKYLHAVKSECKISDERYKKILKDNNIMHASECLSVDQADTIADDIRAYNE